jgi:hypothetical protein
MAIKKTLTWTHFFCSIHSLLSLPMSTVEDVFAHIDNVTVPLESPSPIEALLQRQYEEGLNALKATKARHLAEYNACKEKLDQGLLDWKNNNHLHGFDFYTVIGHVVGKDRPAHIELALADFLAKGAAEIGPQWEIGVVVSAASIKLGLWENVQWTHTIDVNLK